MFTSAFFKRIKTRKAPCKMVNTKVNFAI